MRDSGGRPLNANTGSNLAALRLSRGLSQEGLAAQLGVSRQAVSNWERSESVPDTDNLLRLAEFYGITLDELVARTPQRDAVKDTAAGLDESDGRGLGPFFAFVLCLVVPAAYFAYLAQPLMMSTMDDITQMFGLVPSPTLAVAWFVAEVLFVIAPFALIAVIPLPMPRWTWIAPLGAFVVPVLLSVASVAIGGGPALEYSGIGGALKSSVVIKADVIALILGCSVLIARRGLRRGDVHLTRASSRKRA
ncbi:MAG: helix-turn-helix transcriptional regulator, partial [Coriobacteriia bacterium]|nr:helix-turn-helix transcriptional regulator [Coriobacteriia bacterium]